MRRLALAVALSTAVGGCARGREAPPSLSGAYRGAPVVLISIDTLRADHLPLYGYRDGSTPTLDSLGRSAVVFDEAYSSSPLTLPSHATLLTGRLPPRHGVRDNIGYALGADERTLAARFQAAGYATGAAVSAYVLRHQTGIAAGFDFFDDRLEVAGSGESLSDTQRDGRITVDALAKWIDGHADRALFAFLHLYEPHSPYSPPAAHARALPYDGEIAYADVLVGRLLDRLAAAGLRDRAIVAVVSDHGEGLGDHGEAEHGVFLYREALRVPWILRIPAGAPAGVRIAGTTGLVDVAPTLLDLAGIPFDGMDGESMAAAVANGRTPDRTIYAESWYPRLHFGWSDLASATEGRYRFIRAPAPELYDIVADPGERRNLAGTKQPTASALASWLGKTAGSSTVAEPGTVSPEARERLRALGYATSSAPATAPGSALPDPKSKIAAYEALRHAQALSATGRHADAAAALQSLVAGEPGMLDAWELLGRTFVTLEKTRESIAAFNRVLAIDPLKPETHLALARIFALEGRADRAREHAQLATERDPAAAHELLAELSMDAGRLDEAARHAALSVKADASRYMSRFLIGAVAQRQGRCDEAIAAFRLAIEAKRAEPHAVVRNLHAALADCLARSGQVDEAEREFKAEIAAIPWSPEGRVGLATLYRSQGRDIEARDVLAGVVLMLPRADAEAYWTVVRTLNVLGDTAASKEWAARARALFPADRRFR